MSNYIVHKAVELSKVNKQRQQILSQPMWLEENYIAQPKYDGCNTVVVLFPDGDVQIYSRTGEVVESMEHIALALRVFPNITAGVYLGEAWAPDLEFSDISGLFRRKTASEDTCRLQFAIFDFLTLDEWEAGFSNVAYVNRVARMPVELGAIPVGQAPIYLAGSFGYIAQTFPNTTRQKVCDELLKQGGYDGLILRDPLAYWSKGSNGTTGEIIKVKSKVSLDLRVVGFEEGKGKHAGKIGTLIVEMPNGTQMGAGTGLKDSERDRDSFARDWLGKIVEVEALGYTNSGLLREPRIKGIRHDKTEADKS